MVVNPSNFPVIIIDKKKNGHTREILKINNKIMKASSVKLFVIHIDEQLTFIFSTFVDLQPINLILG